MSIFLCYKGFVLYSSSSLGTHYIGQGQNYSIHIDSNIDLVTKSTNGWNMIDQIPYRICATCLLILICWYAVNFKSIYGNNTWQKNKKEKLFHKFYTVELMKQLINKVWNIIFNELMIDENRFAIRGGTKFFPDSEPLEYDTMNEYFQRNTKT